MDTATARARLERMVQWNVAPLLTAAEIDDLLLLARVRDRDGNDPYEVWIASIRYREGEIRIPTTDNGFFYTVTVAGVSGASEPMWPTTIDETVVDGTVTWENSGDYLWVLTYQLGIAAREGWLWKAAKVVAEYDVDLGSVDATRSQQYQHCIAQANRYGTFVFA